MLSDVGIRGGAGEGKEKAGPPGLEVGRRDPQNARRTATCIRTARHAGIGAIPSRTARRCALRISQLYRDEGGTRLYTATGARQVARLAALYLAPESRDVRAHLDREAARASAAREAAERAERRAALVAEAAAGEYTLEKLFAAYVAHLRKQGKSSATAAEGMFKLHVIEAHPITTPRQCRYGARHCDATPHAHRSGQRPDGRQAAIDLRVAALAARAALTATHGAACPPPFKNPTRYRQRRRCRNTAERLTRALSEPEFGRHLGCLQVLDPRCATRCSCCCYSAGATYGAG